MKGNINISRVHDGTKHWIRTTVEDENSHITFLTLELTLENMMLALTNLGNIDCEFELRGLENIGKKLEHKTEYVYLPNAFQATDEAREEVLKAYEVDGWNARKSDISNHHNFQRFEDGYKVKVSFSRFVEG